MQLKVNFLGICYTSRNVRDRDTKSERWEFVKVEIWKEKNISTIILCV